ncbi:hypothetical protein O181_019184 [Austropuccinia psidii MF-1]|uniref:Uncharacterized protein n=1 Tax=Austropuccinia psidii MF-1 TaxID=1389203 RepID=A0A9Q3GUH1_9BASI|nr:hypothetical protein [Austropuccinia psidii MF-1]
MRRALEKIVSSPTLKPIAQSMLEQSKIRKKRNQAREAHNVAKCATQKEKERWLKAELSKNVHGMRSAVHAHFLFLPKVRNKDFSSLPAPCSTEEHEAVIQVSGNLGYVPKDLFNEPSTQVQSQGFQSYCKNDLHKLGLGERVATSVQQVDAYGVLLYLTSCTSEHQALSLLLEQG